MDFIGAIRLLLRRWYVVVPTMLVSIALAGVAYFSIPTSYQSNGVMVLTSPGAGASYSALVKPEDVPRINPLLAFDSSLSTTAQIVIQVLRDPATATDLGVDDHKDLKYEVNTGDLPGPFIFVEVTGNSAQQVRDMVGLLLKRAQSELESRQRALNAPEQTFITAQLLIQPTEPAPLTGGKVRFTAAALLVGGILTLTSPFAFESITGRRQGRRPESSARDVPHMPPAGAYVHYAGSPVHQEPALVGPPRPPAAGMYVGSDDAPSPDAVVRVNGAERRHPEARRDPGPPASGTAAGAPPNRPGGGAPGQPRNGRRPAPRLRPQPTPTTNGGEGTKPSPDTASPPASG